MLAYCHSTACLYLCHVCHRPFGPFFSHHLSINIKVGDTVDRLTEETFFSRSSNLISGSTHPVLFFLNLQMQKLKTSCWCTERYGLSHCKYSSLILKQIFNVWDEWQESVRSVDRSPIIRILPSQNVSGSHTPWCVTFQGHTHTNTTAALLFLFFSSSKHQSYFFFLLGFSLRSVNKKQQVSNMTPPMHRFSSCGIDLCFIQGCAEVSEELLVLVFIELSTEEALRHDLIRMC